MSYKHRAALKAIEKVAAELRPDTEKVTRKKRARADFAFFLEYYIAPYIEDYVTPAQYQLALIRTVAKRRLVPEDAEIIQAILPEERKKYLQPVPFLRGILDLEPRDHGKTTRMSQALPLWLILTQERVFPVLVFASEKQARDVMESIKLELENNERILEDFGDQRGKVWTGRKIVLNNGNALAVLGCKALA